ncbi:MAG TPA: hypothetical protein VJ809_17390 [Pirellulales bacterium]|nr:hypothetical protein [Pirellulales bacterium]
MQRIIDGILFEGKTLPNQWDVRLWERNGHREISARPVVEWTEIGVDLPMPPANPERDAEDEEEKRQRNLKRNAQRAKTQCRRFIKAHGFGELLTLTYRANQTDEKLFKEHFAKWVRRMRAALGGTFDYCAGFEPQKRGAWHAHVACHKLPVHASYKGVKIEAWKLGTRIWRDIVGPTVDGKDGGLCFVGGKSKWSKSRRRLSVGKTAGYVSKYITKHYELMPEGTNRYSRSNGDVVGKPETMRLYGKTLAEVIADAFMLFEGEVVLSHRVSRWSDAWYLSTEPHGPKHGSDDV